MRCLRCRTPIDQTQLVCLGCGLPLQVIFRDVLPGGFSLANDTYRVNYPLGQGGFGITYHASHVQLRRPMAIKEFFPKEWAERDPNTRGLNILHSESDRFQRWLDRFADEGRILIDLNHPNVVRVTNLFIENGTAYLVMDLIDGGTLRDELDEHPNRSLPEARVEAIVDQLVSALTAIHEKDVLHLDLKPDNILVEPEGTITLVDFGAARQGTSRSTRALTDAYAAPELLGI